jgi:hypothetical protein
MDDERLKRIVQRADIPQQSQSKKGFSNLSNCYAQHEDFINYQQI